VIILSEIGNEKQERINQKEIPRNPERGDCGYSEKLQGKGPDKPAGSGHYLYLLERIYEQLQ
jgi:hypothetical protein